MFLRDHFICKQAPLFKNGWELEKFQDKGAPLDPGVIWKLASKCCITAICWTVTWPIYSGIAMPCVNGSRRKTKNVPERSCMCE